jgi:hypothetical protein
MECKLCGGPMMLETVIKLRHGFIGFREARFAGAYCATCQIGISVGSYPSAGYQDYVTVPLKRLVLDRLTGLLFRAQPMHDLQPQPHSAAFRRDGAAVRQDREASGFV